MKLTFRLKLLLSHAAIALVAAIVAAIAIQASLGPELERQIDTRLESQAEAVSRWLSERSGSGRTGKQAAGHYERLAGRLSAVVDAEVTIINETGVVVAHTGNKPAGDLASATEVQAAKRGQKGRATREGMRYFAVKTANNLITRLAVPISSLVETRNELRSTLFFAAAVALLIAFTLGGFLARTLSRRLQRIRGIAEQVGRGDYDLPHTAHSNDEFGVLSRALTISAEKLNHVDAMRREFLANAAHELRTPVTSIRGYADTLLNSDLEPEMRKDFTKTIQRNALRISALVDELLQLQSLENRDTVDRNTVPVSIDAVLENVMATVRTLATEKGATLAKSDVGDLQALADVDELEQVVQNLVANAIKYGGETPKISLSAKKEAEWVTLRIADNGPGIPEDAMPRIFERFFRVDHGRARREGGNGLGLAIVKELTEAMGGTVTVGKAREGGAEFLVSLPAA